MKWFKHETDATHSEKFARLISEFGFEGYGRYMRIMELIAERMDETDRCHLELPEALWCGYLLVRRPLFRRYLVVIGQLFDNKVITEGSLIRIEMPNLLKKRDNYSKNLQASDKKLASKEVEVEVDVEVDNKEIVHPPKNQPSRPSKLTQAQSELFEELWQKYPNRVGKKAALKYYTTSVISGLDCVNILQALEKYMAEVERSRKNGFPDRQYQSGSTFFNNWQDWYDFEPPPAAPNPEDDWKSWKDDHIKWKQREGKL